jgi:hypothetical protein
MVTWRRLIWAVMFLLVCEGALRKWVFPGLQAQIYLIKDGLLLLAYMGFIASRSPADPHLRAMTGLKSLLLLSLVYLGLQLLNPNSPSIVLSLVGFKNYLLYVPLAFIVPYMFSSSEDLEAKLRKYALLMIPFTALGLVQFAFPPDHWINGYLSHDSENLRAAAMFGTAELEKARTSGTFSYVGGYTVFLTVMFLLGAGLAASNKWRISKNLWPLSLLMVTAAAIFTTGSRGPIYALIITSPLLFFIWTSRSLISTKTAVRIGIVWTIMALAVLFIASNAIEAYDYRAQHADDPIDRLLSPITELYAIVGQTPIIGTGMASTHGSAITIMGTDSYWWLQGILVENETARVFEETGVVGFILIYAARVWLLIKAIALGLRFRTPLYAAMSGVIAAFFAQSLFGFIISNPTGAIYYWFAAGLLFAMHRLELQELAVSPTTSIANLHLRRGSAGHSAPGIVSGRREEVSRLSP